MSSLRKDLAHDVSHGLRLCGGWALAWLAIATTTPIQAATIRNSLNADFPASTPRSQVARIERYVNAGPTHWAWNPPPALPAGLKLTNTDGTLKNDALVQYLAFRRSLSPILFDLRHPKLGSLFLNAAQQQQQAQLNALVTYLKGATGGSVQLLNTTAAGPLKTTPTTTPSSTVNTQAQSVSVAPRAAAQEILVPLAPAPTIVPEPSTIVTTLAAFGLMGAWSRIRRVSTAS